MKTPPTGQPKPLIDILPPSIPTPTKTGGISENDKITLLVKTAKKSNGVNSENYTVPVLVIKC